MNAGATVSVDGAGSAGKARSTGANPQGSATQADGSFAGLMGTAQASRAAAPGESAAPEGEPDGAAPTSAEAATGTAAQARPAASAECSRDGDDATAESDDAEATACPAQVLVLLGLTPPPVSAATAAGPQPARGESRASPAEALTAHVDGSSLETLADTLRALPTGLDYRGDARPVPGSPMELAALLGLAGTAGGIASTAADAVSTAPALQGLESGTGTGGGQVAEAARARGPAQPTAAQAPPTALLQNPVGSQAWSDELGARLATMVDRGEQLATLQLTPDELGPVEVRIALREGEATVWFGAQAVETRAALEQALPRLRELFASGGLALAHAAVNSDTPGDPQRALANSSLARARREGGEVAEQPITTAVAIRRGLLDLYA